MEQIPYPPAMENVGTADIPTSEGPEDSTTPTISSLKSILPILECSICLNLLCEPVSTSCGHTFCRCCLVAGLKRHKRQCPSCRAVCYLSAEDCNENTVIKELCVHLFPKKYEERLLEVAEESKNWSHYVPVFYYNSVVFPGASISLHLFEPRYKLMMQRIVNSSRRFAYVPNFSNYNSVVGDVALIAELQEVEFLLDGRVLLEAKIRSRHTIVDAYIEEGTQGLHYCCLNDLKDEPVVEDVQSELEILMQQGKSLVSELKSLSHWGQLEQIHGEEPRRAEPFSLWLVSVTKTMKTSDKMALLKSTNTVERLSNVMENLATWISDEKLHRERHERPSNPLGLPIPDALTSQGLENMLRMLTGRGTQNEIVDSRDLPRRSNDRNDENENGAARTGQRRGRDDDDSGDSEVWKSMCSLI